MTLLYSMQYRSGGGDYADEPTNKEYHFYLKNVVKRNSSTSGGGADGESDCFKEVDDLSSLNEMAVQPEKHPRCKSEDWVQFDSSGVAKFNWPYLESIKISKISCKYASLEWHKNDFDYKQGEWAEMQDGAAIEPTSEFFRVQCSENGWASLVGGYDSGFARIFAKSPKVKTEDFTRTKNQQPLNIMMIGFDSISREEWLTHLPKSSSFLIKDLNSVVLNKHNIVGDGTPAALIPMFTSKHEHELPNTIKNSEGAINVDDAYPFIWNNFSKLLNYATMYAEDWPNAGTYQYRMKGMRNPPTTHYLRPFEIAVDKLGLKDGNLCLGGRTHLGAHLQYIEDFMNVYEKHGFFGVMFLGEYSHDSHKHLQWIDEILYNYLVEFSKSRFAENTALIFFADHGARFGKMRSTMRGLLRERNPFFSVRLPPLFERRYPEQAAALLSNRNKLTTPMDIYSTLLHMIRLENDQQFEPVDHRSRSLLTRLPDKRRCEDAEIDPYWCACLKRSELKITNNLVRIAKKFVQFINKQILGAHLDKCFALDVQSVNSVHILETIIKSDNYVVKADAPKGLNLLKPPKLEKSFYKFTFQVETSPNDALYEFVVDLEVDADADYIDLNDNSKVMRNLNLSDKKISRLNQYGSQSACIHTSNPELRKYCYCKEQ